MYQPNPIRTQFQTCVTTRSIAYSKTKLRCGLLSVWGGDRVRAHAGAGRKQHHRDVRPHLAEISFRCRADATTSFRCRAVRLLQMPYGRSVWGGDRVRAHTAPRRKQQHRRATRSVQRRLTKRHSTRFLAKIASFCGRCQRTTWAGEELTASGRTLAPGASSITATCSHAPPPSHHRDQHHRCASHNGPFIVGSIDLHTVPSILGPIYTGPFILERGEYRVRAHAGAGCKQHHRDVPPRPTAISFSCRADPQKRCQSGARLCLELGVFIS